MPRPRPALPPRPLLFVRHGESEANAAGVIAGWRDSPLTDNGWRQAAASAALLANQRVRCIYSSPLRRALDTARSIAKACGARIEVVDALRERGYGCLEGTPTSGVMDHFGIHPPGGESWPQFAARVGGGLDRLPRRSTVAVVAHAGVYRVLMERVCQQRFNGRPPNAGVFLIDETATPACRALDSA